MKYILISLLSLPFFATAQDCKLIRETDPYTKETRISSGFITLQGASVSIDADSKEIDFFFTVPDKCYSDASTAFIFFEGSRAKMTYRNSGSMNCDGYFHIKFRNAQGTNSILQKIGNQKVAHFIFTGNDKKEVTVSLLPDQQKLLMEATTCVINQGKTLIK